MTSPNAAPAPVNRLVRPLPELAKTLSVRRLTEALVDGGHSTEAAEAIAFAVCDPTSVRRQLTQPGEMRVADGYLQVIYTSVWTFGVLPYPNNPRTLPAFAYPIAAGSSRRPPLPRELDDPDGRPELVLSVPRPELLAALDAEMTYLMNHNGLADSVAEHGVREPVTLAPLVLDGTDIRGGQGTTRVATLAAVDGSSRTAAAFHLLGVDPMTALGQLVGSGRGIRHQVSETLALAGQDVTSLDESDIARLRALVLPAMLIVGFIPDPGKDASFRDAIDSRLGSIHVEPPKVWSPASRLDVQVDAVLEALVELDKITPEESDWLAGNLTSAQAEEHGFSKDEDRRAARLLEVFEQNVRVVNAALRRLTTKRRIERADRIAVAVEAAIRPFRSEESDQRAQSARSTLAALWAMQVVMSAAGAPPALKVISSRTVVSRAIGEIDDNGVPGLYSRRLLIQAGYWLVRHNLIRKATRGGDADRRAITDVIDTMIHSEHGMQILNRAIIDGRAGRVPRAVDSAGGLLETPERKYIPAAERWIRQTWPDKNGSANTSATSGDTKKRKPTTPEGSLARARDDLTSAIRAVTRAVAALEEPTDDDSTSLVNKVGLPTQIADEMLKQLVDILGKVSRYKEVGRDTDVDSADEED